MGEQVDYYNRSPKLRVTVAKELTKSREPSELGLKITGEKGRIVQVLDDGYRLIEFENLKDPQAIYKKKQYSSLKWYVHKDDLTYA